MIKSTKTFFIILFAVLTMQQTHPFIVEGCLATSYSFALLQSTLPVLILSAAKYMPKLPLPVVSIEVQSETATCTLKSDCSGCEYPELICELVALLNQQTLYTNRILLHGPNGTGKSTLAKLMARATDSEIITIHCSRLVGSYAGSASEAIEQAFIDAKIKFQESKNTKRIFMIFEEIDAIGHQITPGNQNFHEQRTSALQTLCCRLDQFIINNECEKTLKTNETKEEPIEKIVMNEDPTDKENISQQPFERFEDAVFFIFTTNRREVLDPGLLGRIETELEIPNPTFTNRRRTLVRYLSLHKLKDFYQDQEIDILAQKTNGLSLRSIEKVVRMSAAKGVYKKIFKKDFLETEIEYEIKRTSKPLFTPLSQREVADDTRTKSGDLGLHGLKVVLEYFVRKKLDSMTGSGGI